MPVIQAKSAGFCYGVRRAVELAEKTARETGGCVMLGYYKNEEAPETR